MDVIEIKAYGKVNLGLDVTGKRPDGYHLVRMIMQSVGVYDTITAEKVPASECPGEILLTCDVPEVPVGRDNLVYKAAKLLCEKYDIQSSFRIHIEKRIPMAAGMAGGSADAAAAIKAIDSLEDLRMSPEQMDETALKLGADVPFCLRRGTFLAEGIGEKLTRLPDLPPCYMVIVKPSFGVSTPWAYRALDEYIRMHPDEEPMLHPDIDAQIRGLKNRNITEIAAAAGNILEIVTAEEYPQIRKIEERLLSLGAIRALMSGSGPTVFGIFTEKEKADNALQDFGGSEYGKFEVEF